MAKVGLLRKPLESFRAQDFLADSFQLFGPDEPPAFAKFAGKAPNLPGTPSRNNLGCLLPAAKEMLSSGSQKIPYNSFSTRHGRHTLCIVPQTLDTRLRPRWHSRARPVQSDHFTEFWDQGRKPMVAGLRSLCHGLVVGRTDRSTGQTTVQQVARLLALDPTSMSDTLQPVPRCVRMAAVAQDPIGSAVPSYASTGCAFYAHCRTWCRLQIWEVTQRDGEDQAVSYDRV